MKYMPLANNHLVDLLEQEGAEALCRTSWTPGTTASTMPGTSTNFWAALGAAPRWRPGGEGHLPDLRRPAIQALKASRRFDPPLPIAQVAEYAKPFCPWATSTARGGSSLAKWWS